MSETKTAVVTGANRGIGFETSRELARRGFHVVLTARNLAAGAGALKRLQADGLSVELRKLDVTSGEDAQALARQLRETRGRVDVLVNNAGILPDKDGTLDVSAVTLMEILNTNTLGAVRLIQALAPLMAKGGRIVNVSSGLGALGEMGGGQLGYRMSKTALNAVTRVFAAELAARGIAVNSVCPGWVKTDMGGAGATRSVAKGAETIVWLASDPKMTESGGFFRDKRAIAW
ncbi:MAG TPA: SDR family oxidoreductase [Gammaproteobacteria bacterium]|nr:SDR family oxidoreductase [Gammaproteobacteria bacterium]